MADTVQGELRGPAGNLGVTHQLTLNYSEDNVEMFFSYHKMLKCFYSCLISAPVHVCIFYRLIELCFFKLLYVIL